MTGYLVLAGKTLAHSPLRIAAGLGLAALSLTLGACGPLSSNRSAATTTGSIQGAAVSPASATPASERECLVRAMYFESNRSSEDGLLAVGTVVMNRVNSPKYPDTICGVVGQKNQFARGVLTRPMNPRDVGKAEAVADRVLQGERHKKVGRAMHFHQAGLRFSYKNMHYVTVAGGNAFYERRSREEMTASLSTPRPAVTPAANMTVPQTVPASAPQSIEDLIEPAAAYDYYEYE